MEKDRVIIYDIINEMLENPDNGIYDITKALDKLETLAHDRRIEAIGWTHADDCVDLDKGNDPREKELPEMLNRANRDLAV